MDIVERLAEWLYEDSDQYFTFDPDERISWYDSTDKVKENYRESARSLLQEIGINPDLLTEDTRLAIVKDDKGIV